MFYFRWGNPYPARIRVKKAPPHPVRPDLLVSPTSIQEHRQHALPQVDDLLVLLRIRRVGRIICHSVFLGDRRDNQGGVKSNEGISKRGKLRIPSANLEILVVLSAKWNARKPW